MGTYLLLKTKKYVVGIHLFLKTKKKYVVGTHLFLKTKKYVVGTHLFLKKTCCGYSNEALMNTLSICFCEEMRKTITFQLKKHFFGAGASSLHSFFLILYFMVNGENAEQGPICETE